jgi:pyruvate kinase
MNHKIKIICTLGPSSFNPKVLQKLKKEKVDIFRINLSHTKKKDISKRILYLKRNEIKNICIDTEGAQIRTTNVKNKIKFKLNQKVNLSVSKNDSKNSQINLIPHFAIDSLKVGTIIKIGFENLELTVIKKFKNKDSILTNVSSSGYLESNKGVHINQNISLPALSEKDEFAIKIALKNQVKIFALSFANNAENVSKIRSLIGKKSFLISKVETKNAVINLSSICKKSDAILIDRGDLSRYFEIEEIPPTQEKIILSAKKNNTPVYVATNLLETMIKNSEPTRAESNDIFSTLKQGASGLVLAAETAIGLNPLACILFLKKCLKVFSKYKRYK